MEGVCPRPAIISAACRSDCGRRLWPTRPVFHSPPPLCGVCMCVCSGYRQRMLDIVSRVFLWQTKVLVVFFFWTGCNWCPPPTLAVPLPNGRMTCRQSDRVRGTQLACDTLRPGRAAITQPGPPPSIPHCPPPTPLLRGTPAIPPPPGGMSDGFRVAGWLLLLVQNMKDI